MIAGAGEGKPMAGASGKAAILEDFKVPAKVRLAMLWASVMFCYVYGDYFALYIPGKLVSMQAGSMGPLGPATQGVLLGTSIMMAIPSLMVCLSLLLAPRVGRALNIVLGLAYAAIMVLASLDSDWHFYRLLGAVEIVLTLSIAWSAWRWPRHPAAQPNS
ncbi:DUF6326 family protein [Luteimonas aquatica]|uniref:DUF6326 family protein n=1 Tax=Luteimonas aquatica TaxID=450364 RepID=UPI001F59905B|nr:DUF6326 family protein [Luteimonas aquatica]